MAVQRDVIPVVARAQTPARDSSVEPRFSEADRQAASELIERAPQMTSWEFSVDALPLLMRAVDEVCRLRQVERDSVILGKILAAAAGIATGVALTEAELARVEQILAGAGGRP